MATMVMTILESHIPADHWPDLEQGFARLGAEKPPQLTQSFLTQSSADPTLWRLVGIWRSRDDLDEYRASGVTPGGVLLFRSLGAEPTLNLFDVKGQQSV